MPWYVGGGPDDPRPAKGEPHLDVLNMFPRSSENERYSRYRYQRKKEKEREEHNRRMDIWDLEEEEEDSSSEEVKEDHGRQFDGGKNYNNNGGSNSNRCFKSAGATFAVNLMVGDLCTE